MATNIVGVSLSLMAAVLGTAVLFGSVQVTIGSKPVAGPPAVTVPRENGFLNALNEQANLDSSSYQARSSISDLQPGRELSVFYPCIEGQSMTVAMPSSPQMEGCYSVDTAVGKIPLGLGQYVYMSSGGTLTDNEGSGVVMAIPLEDPSDFTNLHWTLSFVQGMKSENVTIYCMSVEHAYTFKHPSSSNWICDFTGNVTDFALASHTELKISCGCSGPPRSIFDRNAASEQRMRGATANKAYGHDSSSSLSFGYMFYLIVLVMTLFRYVGRMMSRASPNNEPAPVRGAAPTARAALEVEVELAVLKGYKERAPLPPSGISYISVPQQDNDPDV